MTNKEIGWLYTNKDRPELIAQLEETGIQIIVREADGGEGIIDPMLRISGKEIYYAGLDNIYKHYIAK